MVRGGAAPPPGWLSRNKWFLPVVALTLMGLCVVGMVAGLMDLFGTLRGWPVYEQALSAVRADPGVSQAIGEPIEVGYIFSGKIETDTGAMVFNVYGPRGGAAVEVHGQRDATQWRPLSVEVFPHDPKIGPITVIEATIEEDSSTPPAFP